jgi:hypothetical protein
MIKRGYFVNEVKEWDNIGVIAGSIKEAKKTRLLRIVL